MLRHDEACVLRGCETTFKVRLSRCRRNRSIDDDVNANPRSPEPRRLMQLCDSATRVVSVLPLRRRRRSFQLKIVLFCAISACETIARSDLVTRKQERHEKNKRSATVASTHTVIFIRFTRRFANFHSLAVLAHRFCTFPRALFSAAPVDGIGTRRELYPLGTHRGRVRDITGVHTRLSDRPPARPSVRPSVRERIIRSARN